MAARLARLTVVVSLALAIAIRAPAHAQFAVEWAFNGAPQAATLASSYLLQKNALEASQALLGTRGRGGRAARPASTVTRGDAGIPATLARGYPAAQRAEAERTYAALLARFSAVEDQLGIPRGDLAGALAMCLVGNLEAYRDRDVDPAGYAPLVKQLRAQLAASAALGGASAATRRALYEQLVITGMFAAEARRELARRPDPRAQASLAQSAHDVLATLLGLDPDAIDVTERGVVAAPRSAP